jgi:(p)ppGpp synthase/HD superfamily hydrolase
MDKNKLNKAIELAMDWHKHDLGKDGKPLMLHLLRVMLKLETEEEQICAILHESFTRGVVTELKLKEYGFENDIINAVKLIDWKPNLLADEYLKNLEKNTIALKVKKNEIFDSENDDCNYNLLNGELDLFEHQQFLRDYFL